MLTDTPLGHVMDIYDARAEIPFDGSTYQSDVTTDLALLQEAVGTRLDSLCDVGCGQGWHLEALNDAVHGSLWGIDVSERSLERFARRTDKIRSGKVRMVLGDVRDWQCSGFFGAVTSFLSCLGEFSEEGDAAYLHSLARLLKPGGILLMSVFCEEMIKPLLGRWTASYSKSDSRPVSTVLTYDRSRRLLRIEQAWDHDTRAVPTETMRLYRCDELRSLAESAGFVNTRVSFPTLASSASTVSGKTGLAIIIAEARERP